jgi:XTP/dITP diphosphohydrolase
MDLDAAATAFREFVTIIKALRTPGTGCPWDLEQDHEKLQPYLVEEAYEVLDAIDGGEDRALCDELGDLLLQIALHAQIADDRGAFSITEVICGIARKMVRRHPHVFGSVQVQGADEVVRNWEQIKAAEAEETGGFSHPTSLDRLPKGLPALLRAQRIGEKTARAGFDWTSLPSVLAKVREEFAELEKAIQVAINDLPATKQAGQTLPEEVRAPLEHELGDVLFSLCQLARWLNLSAEDDLRACIKRFVARFERMQQQGTGTLRELSAEELSTRWQKAKEETGTNPPKNE